MVRSLGTREVGTKEPDRGEGVSEWAFHALHNGSVQREHTGVPIDALWAGPVWLVGDVSGRIYARGTYAGIERRPVKGLVAVGVEAKREMLVIYNGDRQVAAEPTELITRYRAVLVVNPDATSPSGIQPWKGIPAGTEITFAYVRIDDSD